MKNMKKLMFVGLLMTSSVVLSGPVEDNNQLIAKAWNEYIAKRNEAKKNGTPYEKAAITSADLVMNTAIVAINVGSCSYVVDSILGSFDATKNIKNRGTVATKACASLYAAMYASFKHEEMKKDEAHQGSFYDWLASWVK